MRTAATASGAGFFLVVRMTNRPAKASVELRAIQDHFFRMHRLDRVQRHRELTCVLDIDHQMRMILRSDLPNCAKFLAAIGNESLESHFNFFLHDEHPLRLVESTVPDAPISPNLRAPRHVCRDSGSGLDCRLLCTPRQQKKRTATRTQLGSTAIGVSWQRDRHRAICPAPSLSARRPRPQLCGSADALAILRRPMNRSALFFNPVFPSALLATHTKPKPIVSPTR